MLIALLSSVPMALAQADVREAQPLPPAPERAARIVQEQSFTRDPNRIHYDRPYGEDIWVRGPGYKARFGADGSEFIPFLGSDAKRNHPVDISLLSVTVGGASLELDENQPQRDGSAIAIDRGTLLERYLVSTEGVEQTFVFDEPVSGEIVVRVGAEAEVPAERTADGFEFHHARGGVRVSEAIAIDATGRRLDLESTWTNGVFEYRVPAEFTATAAYPLTIDPLYADFVIDNFGAGLRTPRVAYDPASDSYLCVYTEQFSGQDYDMYSRRVALDGTLLWEGYIDLTGDNWTEPDVAACQNRFLVTARRQNFSFSVVSRLLDSTAAVEQYGTTQTHSIEDTYITGPQVGGDILDRFLIVFAQGGGEFDSRIRAVLVGDDGLEIMSAFDLTPPTGFDNNPAVSRINHHTNTADSTWCVAFVRDLGGSQRQIWATDVRWSGTVVNAPYPVYQGSQPASEPRVSSPLDHAGPHTYMITYNRDFGSDFDIDAAVVREGNVEVVRNMSFAGLSGGTGFDDEMVLAVDSNGERFSMTWRDSSPPSGKVTTMHFLGGDICVTENQNFSPSLLIPTGLAALRQPGTHDYLCVAEDWTVPGNENIHGAQLHDSTQCLGFGYCFSNPNSTGYVADLYGDGTGVAGDPITLQARRLPLNQNAMFIVSRSQQNVPLFQGRLCLGTPIGRFSTMVQNSGTTGEVSIDVDTNAIPIFPTSAALPGETMYFQCWFRDVNPTSTSNLTSGWQVTFQ